MAKAKTPTDEKFEKIDFDLFEALAAIDRKDYGYYDRLTEEQKNKFSPFMLIKYLSSVKASLPIQQFHVLSTQEFANIHLFNENVQSHPKLQWLMLCAAGFGNGKQFHPWIPQIKESVSSLKDEAKKTDIKEFYKKTNPKLDEDSVDELAELFVNVQNKKCYLAKVFPNLKTEDIDTLSRIVTDEDILKYERDYGN